MWFQIGQDDRLNRDVRMVVSGPLSSQLITIKRRRGDINKWNYVVLSMDEAMRLYNALGQVIYSHQQCERHFGKDPEPENDDTEAV